MQTLVNWGGDILDAQPSTEKKTKQNETFFAWRNTVCRLKIYPVGPIIWKPEKKKQKEKIQETNLESSTLTKCPNISFRS